MIEKESIDRTLTWAKSSCVRHYMEGRQDAIAIVSTIKPGDNDERVPYNMWEEGGFRLEVINKQFQEWTGIKLFALENWDKPVFQLIENL